MQIIVSGREVIVPDLGGLPLEEAQAALARADLRLEEAGQKHDPATPKGLILSQDPAPRATLKKNRKVKVTLSLGPEVVTIPDLRGQTLRSAQLVLQREGLLVGHVTYTHDRAVPANTVMEQRPGPSSEEEAPAAGEEEASSEGRVRLLVSRGPEEVEYVMPDLSGYRLEDVREFAGRAGLRIGAIRTEPHPRVVPGRVVRQYPQAGYPVGRRDIISLVLSE